MCVCAYNGRLSTTVVIVVRCQTPILYNALYVYIRYVYDIMLR